MSYRKKRTIVATFGDVRPEDHGGGALMREGSDLVLEYTQGIDSESLDDYQNPIRGATVEVYRLDVPTIKGRCDIERIREDLASYFKPFARGKVSVLDTIGMDPWEALGLALDPDRAWALYEIVAASWGWHVFDEQPMSLPYWRVARRWTAPRRKAV